MLHRLITGCNAGQINSTRIFIIPERFPCISLPLLLYATVPGPKGNVFFVAVYNHYPATGFYEAIGYDRSDVIVLQKFLNTDA